MDLITFMATGTEFSLQICVQLVAVPATLLPLTGEGGAGPC